MHELALLHGVVAAVAKKATAIGATSVDSVTLRVGSLSGAIPEALAGAWPLAIDGTALEGAELSIEMVQAAIWCPTCQACQAIDEFYAWTCPVCGTASGQMVAGREFEVRTAEMTCKS